MVGRLTRLPAETQKTLQQLDDLLDYLQSRQKPTGYSESSGPVYVATPGIPKGKKTKATDGGGGGGDSGDKKQKHGRSQQQRGGRQR